MPAILTTTSEKDIKRRLKGRMGYLARLKNNIITGSDVKKIKPNPKGIQKLIDRTGIPANRMIMVGDSHVDIQAGKTIVEKTIGVLSGLATEGKMRSEQADYIVKNFNEIPDVFEKILAIQLNPY